MTTVLLIRHGLTALTGSTLLGRTAGVPLDERGRAQASLLAGRIRPIGLAAIVSSPIERCRETAELVLAGRQPAPPFELDDRLADVDYGDWTGRLLKDLSREPLWKTVHSDPSAVRFPNGEALREMGARAVGAVRDWNDRLGPKATYAIVSHADPIRAILADALGVHFDGYVRVAVSPASLSVVRYGPGGAQVIRLNDSGGDVADLVPAKKRATS